MQLTKLAASSVSGFLMCILFLRHLWCAPFAVSSIGVLCIAASSLVYYEQNIQSLSITLGADPEIVQGAVINAYRVSHKITNRYMY